MAVGLREPWPRQPFERAAGRDCPLCPRLVAFRARAQAQYPDWFNAPVPLLRRRSTRGLLIVGLAPGLQGANRTGRPFTGDYAGDLLYATLLRVRLRRRAPTRADRTTAWSWSTAAITNAVRCVPPENKPSRARSPPAGRSCSAELAAMPKLAVVLALGAIAHDAGAARRSACGRPAPIRSAMAGCTPADGPAARRQLSLLALQHEHRPADDGDVPRRLQDASGGSWRLSIIMRLLAHRTLVDAARLHYAQPHRGYHNTDHLDELIGLARELTPVLGVAEQLALCSTTPPTCRALRAATTNGCRRLLMTATVDTLALNQRPRSSSNVPPASSRRRSMPRRRPPRRRGFAISISGVLRHRGKHSSSMRSAFAASTCLLAADEAAFWDGAQRLL